MTLNFPLEWKTIIKVTLKIRKFQFIQNVLGGSSLLALKELDSFSKLRETMKRLDYTVVGQGEEMARLAD